LPGSFNADKRSVVRTVTMTITQQNQHSYISHTPDTSCSKLRHRNFQKLLIKRF